MIDKKKILITGANGFIGSRVTKFFFNNGYDVGIIKRNNSDCSRINDILPNLISYDCDISDSMQVAKVVDNFKPSVIIHLATYYSLEHNHVEIENMYNTNVLGITNLLEAGRNNTSLFINTSTCFVYKNRNRSLIESDQLEPLNLYALTKKQSEDTCSYYSSKYGLKTITLRLFPPYGPGDNKRRLIPFLLDKLSTSNSLPMNTGEQMWDFVFVDDIVDAYYRVISNIEKIESGEIFNVSTGNPIKIKKIAAILSDYTNSNTILEWGKNPHRENEIWHLSGNYQMLNNKLGWKPRHEIADGLKRTIEWHNQN